MKYSPLMLLSLALFFSCISSQDSPEVYSDPIPVSDRDNSPCNSRANQSTQAVLAYLAELSADPFQGVIVGQNCGHTDNIYTPQDMMSYATLVEGLQGETGKWVGILGVDYEHDRIYSDSEISQANQILIDYWNAGGLIHVGLSPINPWLNDELDTLNNPGFWLDTRTSNLSQAQLDEIDLSELVDPMSDIYSTWLRKLDRIARGLQELEDAGVVVLFKPMQEQNGDWFWWGNHSHPNDPQPYVDVYRHMFHYFTEVKGLDNLLWMYSPANGSLAGQTSWWNNLLWTYPGEDYVDILAPTLYTKDLVIYGYQELVETGKPLAMAEMGPDHEDNHGAFDNRTYINRISRSYTGISFWISWEDWDNGNGTNTYMSILNNENAYELMNHPEVITREYLRWREFLP